jgi:uncharacterized protein YbbK (DUF523 family)
MNVSKRRIFCVNGCGRRSQKAGGVCSSCEQGRAVPRPRPDILPTEYLLECTRELARRQRDMTEALRAVKLAEETFAPPAREVA